MPVRRRRTTTPPAAPAPGLFESSAAIFSEIVTSTTPPTFKERLRQALDTRDRLADLSDMILRRGNDYWGSLALLQAETKLREVLMRQWKELGLEGQP